MHQVELRDIIHILGRQIQGMFAQNAILVAGDKFPVSLIQPNAGIAVLAVVVTTALCIDGQFVQRRLHVLGGSVVAKRPQKRTLMTSESRIGGKFSALPPGYMMPMCRYLSTTLSPMPITLMLIVIPYALTLLRASNAGEYQYSTFHI